MKIKINNNGSLMIERAGKFKVVYCPFDYNSECGDWCSLFSEPYHYANEKRVCINLCNNNNKTCKVEDFIDERREEG